MPAHDEIWQAVQNNNLDYVLDILLNQSLHDQGELINSVEPVSRYSFGDTLSMRIARSPKTPFNLYEFVINHPANDLIKSNKNGHQQSGSIISSASPERLALVIHKPFILMNGATLSWKTASQQWDIKKSAHGALHKKHGPNDPRTQTAAQELANLEIMKTMLRDATIQHAIDNDNFDYLDLLIDAGDDPFKPFNNGKLLKEQQLSPKVATWVKCHEWIAAKKELASLEENSKTYKALQAKMSSLRNEICEFAIEIDEPKFLIMLAKAGYNIGERLTTTNRPVGWMLTPVNRKIGHWMRNMPSYKTKEQEEKEILQFQENARSFARAVQEWKAVEARIAQAYKTYDEDTIKLYNETGQASMARLAQMEEVIKRAPVRASVDERKRGSKISDADPSEGKQRHSPVGTPLNFHKPAPRVFEPPLDLNCLPTFDF